MKNLETIILSFDNWTQPWTFFDQICGDKNLNNDELKLFKEIWIKASDFKFWNYSDLAIGGKASHNFIKDVYKLPDAVISKIVNAIAYQWR